MAAELARRGLADHRRALAGWCFGIAGYCLLVASIFPSIKGSEAFTKLLEDYPDALKSLFGLSSAGDLSTGAGFIDAELFSLMLPLLVLVLGISSGARTFAGEEEAGRLELLLSYPVRRRNALLAKAAAVAAEILILAAAGFLALLVLDPVFGLDLGFWRLVAAMGGLAALGLFYGWLALCVGASVPSKLLAIAVPAGYAAAAYLVSGLHDLAGWLDPLRFLSPFWLIGSSPLQDGVDGWGVLVVLTAALAAVAIGAVLVERRDLEVP
jgi:beta-exotoxin I transport system permease protein